MKLVYEYIAGEFSGGYYSQSPPPDLSDFRVLH